MQCRATTSTRPSVSSISGLSTTQNCSSITFGSLHVRSSRSALDWRRALHRPRILRPFPMPNNSLKLTRRAGL